MKNGDVYELVIIGRGSAAAYYLSYSDLSLYPRVLVVGQEDPWKGARGHADDAHPDDPTLLINHPMHLIAHVSDQPTSYGDALVDRVAWAKKNDDVIKGALARLSQSKSLRGIGFRKGLEHSPGPQGQF